MTENSLSSLPSPAVAMEHTEKERDASILHRKKSSDQPVVERKLKVDQEASGRTADGLIDRILYSSCFDSDEWNVIFY